MAERQLPKLHILDRDLSAQKLYLAFESRNVFIRRRVRWRMFVNGRIALLSILIHFPTANAAQSSINFRRFSTILLRA